MTILKNNDLDSNEDLATAQMQDIRGGFAVGIVAALQGFDFGTLAETSDFDEPLADMGGTMGEPGPAKGGFGTDNGPIGDGKK